MYLNFAGKERPSGLRKDAANQALFSAGGAGPFGDIKNRSGAPRIRETHLGELSVEGESTSAVVNDRW